jgi:hypothetical protein
VPLNMKRHSLADKSYFFSCESRYR